MTAAGIVNAPPAESGLELLAVAGADLYASLSKSERESIAQKLAQIPTDDYDAKQRVALAIKYCAPGKAVRAVELFASVGTSPETPVKDDEAKFGTQPLPREHETTKNEDGTYTVKDVPIFGENERSSFMSDCNYDSDWLQGAHKADRHLAKNGYRAPMHFGHHTFSGAPVERAGHFEITKVAKHKHLGKKLHVMFANLHFKDEPTLQKYLKDYPHRSVEISHERPDQINSLALLSHEAPYFQFPIAAHKFGTDVSTATDPVKAHYFTWGDQAFADAPPKKGKKPFPPKKGGDEESGDEGADDGDEEQGGFPPKPGQAPQAPADPGTNENDVIVAMLHGIMGLLNKLVDSNLNQIGQGHMVDEKPDELDQDEDNEPDGDEPEPDDKHDGAKHMSDGNKNKPVVAASADTATMEGKIAALEAEVVRLRTEREREQAFATLKTELAPYGIVNLDVELRKRVDDGTAQSWAAGIKQIAPPARRSEEPTAPAEDPALAKFIKENPKVDASEVRRLADVYAAAEGHPLMAVRAIRNVPLDRYLSVQLDMAKRS